MKNLTKIGLFVLVIALGIFIIDNSISASTLPCDCSYEHDAYLECEDVCVAVYNVDCLDTYWIDSGCEYRDCLTIWKFECENRAKGYTQTEVSNCPDCYNW